MSTVTRRENPGEKTDRESQPTEKEKVGRRWSFRDLPPASVLRYRPLFSLTSYSIRGFVSPVLCYSVHVGSDPFAKKDWYDIKALSLFQIKNIGKTLVSRIQGTKIASEGLKHRVFEVSLADLQNDEDHSYRKIKLRAEDVQGRNVLTNFWGMNFTTDKLRSLVRKAQTLIEAHVDVKTTDGYTLRMFSIGFTKKRTNQQKRTCYAQSSQIRQIRRKMTEIMVNQASSCDLKDLVQKFIPESIGREIEKATAGIFPMQNVFIRKVKILKAPKFDLPKLMEVHGDYSEDAGVKIDRPMEETVEAPAELVGA